MAGDGTGDGKAEGKDGICVGEEEQMTGGRAAKHEQQEIGKEEREEIS